MKGIIKRMVNYLWRKQHTIHYEQKNDSCYTACPWGRTGGITNKSTMVGSYACKHDCGHFVYQDKEQMYIICSREASYV